jgi:hypothetical protein
VSQQESLLQKEAAKQVEIDGYITLLARHEAKHSAQEQEIERLHEIIRHFKLQLYGSKKERYLSQDQLLLFNEAEIEVLKSKRLQSKVLPAHAASESHCPSICREK